MWQLDITDFFNLGTLGGAIFLASWLLQLYESKKLRKSIVSMKFWSLRMVGLIVMTIYSFQIESLIFILINIATGAIVISNMYILLKNGN